jgi:hypothetical protein
MDTITILGLLTFAAFLAVGTVPIYMSFRVKTSTLRMLSILLGAFAITHGFYHLADSFSQGFLADAVFEPISVAFLLSLGLYYSKKGLP